MDPAHLVFAVFAGIAAGLIIYAVLLLSGIRIIARLGLAPTADDLPEDLKYQPAAPPLVESATPEAARAVAALQQRRQAACATAHQVLVIGRTIGDRVLAAQDAGHPRLTEFQAKLKDAEALVAQAEGAMHHADLEQADARTAEALAAMRALSTTVDAIPAA